MHDAWGSACRKVSSVLGDALAIQPATSAGVAVNDLSLTAAFQKLVWSARVGLLE